MADDWLNIDSSVEPLSGFVLLTRAGSFSGFVKDFHCGTIDIAFTKVSSISTSTPRFLVPRAGVRPLYAFCEKLTTTSMMPLFFVTTMGAFDSNSYLL